VSREGTDWLDVLKTLVSLIDPGSEWRLHREWYLRKVQGRAHLRRARTKSGVPCRIGTKTIATCIAETARRAAAEEANMVTAATLEASLPWVASGG